MTNLQVVSQIINAIGSIINMTGINFKEKNKILISFILGNICIAIALGMLNAVSGMIIQTIFVIETIINYFYEKNKGEDVKYPMWMILLYVIVPTVILLLFYSSNWDLLPMMSGILFPLAMISKELSLRVLNLLSVLFWIPYNFVFGQYVGAISCSITSIVNLIAIIRLDVLKNKK